MTHHRHHINDRLVMCHADSPRCSLPTAAVHNDRWRPGVHRWGAPEAGRSGRSGQDRMMDEISALRLWITAAHRDLDREHARLLRAAGLTPAQADALRVLQEHGVLTVRDLGDLLVRESGSPSRLARTLVESGWVGRTIEPFDARVSVLGLSPLGRRFAGRAERAEARLHDTMAQRIDAALLDQLSAGLASITYGPAGAAVRRRIRGRTWWWP